MNPAPATALVAVRDLQSEFHWYWRPRAVKIDEHAATQAAWSFVEGYERAIARVFGPALGEFTRDMTRVQQKLAPSYTELRGWLYGELEFSYPVACRIALQFTTRRDFT